MNQCWRSPSSLEQQIAHLMAGHAAVALFEGLEVVEASMGYGDGGSSWIEVLEPNLSKSRLRSSARAKEDAKSVIRALLAGPAAQIRYSFGYYPMEFKLSDRFLLDQEAIWRAISIADKATNNGPALIRALWGDAMQMIGNATIWAAIEAVASSLLDNGELAGCELVEITSHVARQDKSGPTTSRS